MLARRWAGVWRRLEAIRLRLVPATSRRRTRRRVVDCVPVLPDRPLLLRVFAAVVMIPLRPVLRRLLPADTRVDRAIGFLLMGFRVRAALLPNTLRAACCLFRPAEFLAIERLLLAVRSCLENASRSDLVSSAARRRRWFRLRPLIAERAEVRLREYAPGPLTAAIAVTPAFFR